MSIRLETPPDDAVDAAMQGLSYVVASRGTSLVGHGDLMAGPLSLSAPHRVFTLPLDALLQVHPLESALFTGWSFIVLDRDTPVASLEVGENVEPSRPFSFTNLSRGPFVEGTIEAFRRAENTEASDLAIRLLCMPSLYFVALWLTEPSHTLLPIAPAPAGLVPYERYTEQAAMDVLRDILAVRRAGESRTAFNAEGEPRAP